jgi:cytidylate kinase
MGVITISRQFGAAGRTLGKTVAERLGWDFYDELLIQKIAEEAKVSEASVQSFETHERGTSLTRVISGLVSRSFVERLLDEGGYLNNKVYAESLNKVMNEIADSSDAVLLGRGGQYILKNHADAHHVLLIGKFEHRVQFMCDNYMMTPKEARVLVRREDKRRANFYKTLGKEDYEDPRLYDVVINLTRAGLHRAVEIVLELVS